MDTAKETGKSVHLMGLVSDGGVHSHNTHLYALLEMCKRRGVEKVYVHCFLDGRDVPPTSGIDYVRELQAKMDEIGVGKIATVMGRYWAMDRDNLWDRVQKAYDAMVLGQGQATAETAVQAVEQSYAKEETDEFVKPTVVLENGQPVATIGEGDSVIFFNFRPDRARQLTRTFIQPDFNGFPRGKGYFHVNFVSMTQYDETFTGLEVVNPPETLKNTLGEYLSKLGKTQLRIAETQKYAHVTFFFNGGVEKPNEGEDRVLIPSSKVATFDMKPEMSAYEITDKAIELINEKKYDVMILNFANCDMVGHTGVMEAAMKAVAAWTSAWTAWSRLFWTTAGVLSSRPITATRTRWWTPKRESPSPLIPPTPCPSLRSDRKWWARSCAKAAAWPISHPRCWTAWGFPYLPR